MNHQLWRVEKSYEPLSRCNLVRDTFAAIRQCLWGCAHPGSCSPAYSYCRYGLDGPADSYSNNHTRDSNASRDKR
jgi:hypothetical protein